MDTQLYQFTVQIEELRSRNIELAKGKVARRQDKP